MTELQGNCLTLAIMTTALADNVGVRVSYRKVNTDPVYYLHNQVLTRSTHVVTYLHNPENDAPGVMRDYVKIDYFPGGNEVYGDSVTHDEFLSMYYRNLFAEALADNQLENAYSHAQTALAYAPDRIENLNSMAVIYRRMGFEKAALALYRWGFEHSTPNLTFAENYGFLLRRLGLQEEAAGIAKQTENIKDDNPYMWIDRANTFMQHHNFYQAQQYFEKATQLAPYLHEGYWGLARANIGQGKVIAAQRHMKRAAELAAYTPDEKRYQAKLDALSQTD